MNAPRVRLAVALAAMVLSACALVAPPADLETRKAVLDQVPVDLPKAPSRAATLLILAPEADAAYDTTKMAYVEQAHRIEYFARHEWSERPGQMIQPLLVRTIESTSSFRTVFTPPYFGPYSYALRTRIVELKQDFTAAQPAAELRLRVELSGETASRVIAAKEIALREPMREKTPEAGVAAANRAMAAALREIAQFVLRAAA